LRRPLDSSAVEVDYRQYGCADPVTERNLALWTAHQHTDADAIVFIDHDQAFPAGTIETLARQAVATRGICGALIAKKGKGAGLAAVPYANDDQDFTPGEPTFVKLKAVGTGMLAIHRSVVDVLAKGLDRVLYGADELPPLFDNVYVRDGAITRRLGEDISFCFRCREAGIPIYGAQGPEVEHVGEYKYTWRDARLADERRRFNVVTIRPDGYMHSDSFREMSTLLSASLRDLGHDVVENENAFAAGRTNVVLGANLLAAADQEDMPPTPFVVYQLEQLADRRGWTSGDRGARYLDVLRSASEVWDYAPENIAWLAAHGVKAKHLAIGYHRALKTIDHSADKDIDVLFYGSRNERRAALLEELRRRGLSVTARWADCYGEERDALIARAKVVLCCHYYEAQVMEQLRISHLLNNGAFVVAESSAVDPYKHLPFVRCTYTELAETVENWARTGGEARDRVATDSAAAFAKTIMTDNLAAVLL
jgi:hypothetical protein